MRHSELPITVLRMWPMWNGFAMFGELKSMQIVWPLPGARPNGARPRTMPVQTSCARALRWKRKLTSGSPDNRPPQVTRRSNARCWQRWLKIWWRIARPESSPSAGASPPKSTLVPGESARRELDRIIWEELSHGIVRPESRAVAQSMLNDLADHRAEAIVLGCTELCLLIKPEDSPRPLYDTTQLHALAILNFALDDGTSK